MKKKKKEQFFESKLRKKEGTILWVKLRKKKFNPFSDIQEGFNSFNSFTVFFFKKKINSVSQLKNKAQLCESDEKSSILWVMFKRGSNIWLIFPKINSVNHIKNKVGSTLQIILEKFYPLSHIEKVLLKKKMFNSSSHMLKRVQFFE